MVRFLIKAAFGDEMFVRVKRLLQGRAYFDLVVKSCDTYLRPGTYKMNCGKAKDAQYS